MPTLSVLAFVLVLVLGAPDKRPDVAPETGRTLFVKGCDDGSEDFFADAAPCTRSTLREAGTDDLRCFFLGFPFEPAGMGEAVLTSAVALLLRRRVTRGALPGMLMSK